MSRGLIVFSVGWLISGTLLGAYITRLTVESRADVIAIVLFVGGWLCTGTAIYLLRRDDWRGDQLERRTK